MSSIEANGLQSRIFYFVGMGLAMALVGQSIKERASIAEKGGIMILLLLEFGIQELHLRWVEKG